MLKLLVDVVPLLIFKPILIVQVASTQVQVLHRLVILLANLLLVGYPLLCPTDHSSCILNDLLGLTDLALDKSMLRSWTEVVTILQFALV